MRIIQMDIDQLLDATMDIEQDHYYMMRTIDIDQLLELTQDW